MALSQRLGVQWPSLIRTLNQLEADGLITREDNPEDRRSRLIRITSAGDMVMRQVKPVLDRTRHGILEHVTDQQLRDAIELLGLIPNGKYKTL